jgi:PAS domain S-box-containing protein
MNRERELMEENERLQKRLQEAEELIDAIRNGRVDALVVSKPGHESIYTLKGANHTYRILIETMDEGAVILSREATILYCNRSFAQILQIPLHQLTGSTITEYIAAQDREQFDTLHRRVFAGKPIRAEINLVSARKSKIPSLISLRTFLMDGLDTVCMVVTDLTEQKEKDASLAEKEILLKEIHHRVKNNMQVISSLVDLQADEVKDDAVRGIFQDVIYRVRSMAMVHEKLYQSADLSRVDFGDYAQSLLQYLWRAQGAANGGFQLELELESILMPVNAAVPCGLILNELFSNALKHAFRDREGGRVTVRLGEDGAGRARLDVCDDGVGLPAGFDWRSAPSLGLRLVQMLARQLHAAVELESADGTTFTITFEVHQS